MYLDGPDYEKYVVASLAKEKMMIEKMNLRDLMA